MNRDNYDWIISTKNRKRRGIQTHPIKVDIEVVKGKDKLETGDTVFFETENEEYVCVDVMDNQHGRIEWKSE